MGNGGDRYNNKKLNALCATGQKYFKIDNIMPFCQFKNVTKYGCGAKNGW